MLLVYILVAQIRILLASVGYRNEFQSIVSKITSSCSKEYTTIARIEQTDSGTINAHVTIQAIVEELTVDDLHRRVARTLLLYQPLSRRHMIIILVACLSRVTERTTQACDQVVAISRVTLVTLLIITRGMQLDQVQTILDCGRGEGLILKRDLDVGQHTKLRPCLVVVRSSRIRDSPFRRFRINFSICLSVICRTNLIAVNSFSRNRHLTDRTQLCQTDVSIIDLQGICNRIVSRNGLISLKSPVSISLITIRTINL